MPCTMLKELCLPGTWNDCRHAMNVPRETGKDLHAMGHDRRIPTSVFGRDRHVKRWINVPTSWNVLIQAEIENRSPYRTARSSPSYVNPQLSLDICGHHVQVQIFQRPEVAVDERHTSPWNGPVDVYEWLRLVASRSDVRIVS